MKTSNEILQALRLSKSKEVMNFCSKLASIFIFLTSIKDMIIEAAIIGTGFTIDKDGKLLDKVKMRLMYNQSMLSNYRYNDKHIKELNRSLSSLCCELSNVRETLWKKRKNKSNTELEAKRDQLDADIKAINDEIELFVKAEDNRLQKLDIGISDMRKELKLFAGSQIEVKTNKGEYRFYVPIANAFYYAVLRLLNIPFEVAKVEVISAKYKFITYPEIIECIKKAAKFVSDDDLRPVFQCVCLDFSDKGLQVISTDAHRMYYSKYFSFEKGINNTQLLISPESVKVLCKVKPDYENALTISVFNDNTADINGIAIKLFTEKKYPDYKVVIPEYTLSMEFEKDNFIQNVKKVMPFANKSTTQINFHLNGNIEMTAQDVDFSFESIAQVAYLSKDLPDTDIAFNGKFLVEACGVFKDKTLKMYHDGKNTHAGIFTNGKDSVLVMPLMLNS